MLFTLELACIVCSAGQLNMWDIWWCEPFFVNHRNGCQTVPIITQQCPIMPPSLHLSRLLTPLTLLRLPLVTPTPTNHRQLPPSFITWPQINEQEQIMNHFTPQYDAWAVLISSIITSPHSSVYCTFYFIPLHFYICFIFHTTTLYFYSLTSWQGELWRAYPISAEVTVNLFPINQFYIWIFIIRFILWQNCIM